MNRLPTEILHKIFIQVNFEQILECMLVCSDWYSVLFHRSLLYDMGFNDEHEFRQFVNIIEPMPSRGAQVEFLGIDLPVNDYFQYQRILNMFPNLRVIQLAGYTSKQPKQIFCGEPLELQSIDSKLEEIKDPGDYKLAQYLIMTNSCTRLTSLELDISKIEAPGKEIFAYFKNTPALKNIHLNHVKIRIEDYEILHENAFALEKICLLNIILKAGVPPRNIIAATSVKRFEMYIYRIEDNNLYPNWYKYLAKKYTNLIDFKYEDGYIPQANPDQTVQVYRDGIVPIYKNTIRKHFDDFSAYNIPMEADIFNKLFEVGVRFETFKFDFNEDRLILAQLAESGLSKYAKRIFLVNTIINSPTILQNFTSLKKLHIFLYGSNNDLEVNMTDILNELPPTLTSFVAFLGHVKIDKLPTHANNIEEFHLKCYVLLPKLGEVISNYFPNLNRLHLSGLVIENLNINLPNSHFKELSIDASFGGDLSHGFSVVNTKDSSHEYYIGKIYGDYGTFYTTSATAEEIQDRVNINIIYSTAEQTRYSTCPL